MTSDVAISVFDMLKVGVGPSSSHTLGPWRAALAFVELLDHEGELARVTSVRIDLFGSLAKTGRGHGTGMAVMMGLSGHDPVTCDVDLVVRIGPDARRTGQIALAGLHPVTFDRERDLRFHGDRTLPEHPNGLSFHADVSDASGETDTVSLNVYSVGGGFVTHDRPIRRSGRTVGATWRREDAAAAVRLPAPISSAADLQRWCEAADCSIADIVRSNERAWRTDSEIDADLLTIRDVMLACVYRGCRSDGILPGGLLVTRRAKRLHHDLFGPADAFDDPQAWFEALRSAPVGFDDSVALLSCFALAVNEENAAFGRVVTAPTNGAAGVIPAVMFHHLRMLDPATHGQAELDAEALRFLLVAAEIGAIFKQGSTISAALGGCQAEIGVSSAMAAAALTECRGGTVRQSLMAAEIAMEHHLGLTCDPVGGLVQVPCIERNAMGAIKAISASLLARASDPDLARVSLDDVIDTMWRTAQDMHANYKETAEGGLAVRIPVNVVEC